MEKNWVFIDIWAGGVNPNFSMIHHIVVVTPDGGHAVTKYIDVESLSRERIILGELCDIMSNADVLYMNDAAYKYLRECFRQYHMRMPKVVRKTSVAEIKSYKFDEFTGELKTFFKDYKDYYYLPAEDYAIHKSVGEFVDRSARKQATAHTAYIKKAGTFIPVYDETDMIFTAEYRSWPRYCLKCDRNTQGA